LVEAAEVAKQIPELGEVDRKYPDMRSEENFKVKALNTFPYVYFEQMVREHELVEKLSREDKSLSSRD